MSMKSSNCRELGWPSSRCTQLSVGLSVTKFARTSKWRPFRKFRNILERFNLTTDMERSSEIIPKKVFLMLMTSLTTSQRDVKLGLLYSCLKEIVIFSVIQVTVCNQSSLNLAHICSLVRHIGLQMLVKGQITRSWGKEIGQILKLS